MLHKWKVVRTDAELRMSRVDDKLRAAGAKLVQLPDRVSEDILATEVADADLLLVCYSRVTAQVIDKATRLKAIIKYGVGIDSIDVVAARERGIEVRLGVRAEAIEVDGGAVVGVRTTAGRLAADVQGAGQPPAR